MSTVEAGRPRTKVALITGASSGIGQALALALAAGGYSLGLVGRSGDVLEALATRCAASGLRAHAYPCDLASEDAVRQLAQRAIEDFEAIDTLVHCAGQYARGSVGRGSLSEFDNLFRVNVRAPFLLTQLTLASIANCQGQIVFVNSSVAAMPARADEALYASGKYALRAIADSLRAEANALGVRVLSIFPGRTATPMQRLIHGLEGNEYRPERLLQPEDVAQAIVGALGLPRTAEITELHVRPMLKA